MVLISKLSRGTEDFRPKHSRGFARYHPGDEHLQQRVVDCTASKDVAALYQSLLEHNVSIIAANKIAASSEYENYEKLKKTAIQRGVVFRFETNVGAGLPIIGTINDLRNSGDKILKIEAVLSGTLNFIFNAISSVVPFSETVRLAKERATASQIHVST